MGFTSQHPSARAIHIAIADDHPVIRHAAAAALKGMTGVHIVASVASGAELLTALQGTRCDLIITDLLMPGAQADSDGLPLMQRLKRLYPDTPILVFTMVRNRDVLLEVDQMNVAGIVTKSEEVGVFIEATLNVVVQRLQYRSAAVRAILDAPPPATPALHDRSPLSGKELEVIRLYGAGLSLTEIAARLNRSISTIATQKGNAMRKLGIERNADMIRYVQSNRLIQ
ncbi:response regulator transcription factor [Paraburkholderia rhizosphaerae]|uniref:LuxR family two component transcriptional regulator n=1 Tax=Paraburkholderia rhizosphaerae TaxID=480658 RepID=A0A4R8M3Q0_9BURK|nr:response regulator transcription factor [Paraburkholderia rhizosphaerae]TDY54184.1 LuxR family two component transcriptional regulator [Paraburkholderia rhizosphaerae]